MFTAVFKEVKEFFLRGTPAAALVLMSFKRKKERLPDMKQNLPSAMEEDAETRSVLPFHFISFFFVWSE